MSELKIGNRVKVISDPKFIEFTGEKSIIGMTGTVKELDETCVGVEFDDYVGGHYGNWNGKSGYCWYLSCKRLEKIEEIKAEPKTETKAETKAETKTETMKQKILEVLRAEIGVDIGEEFSVCKIGGEQWACKFEENGFTRKMNGNFYESGFWKSIISDFQSFKFKKKPFIPKKWENYWSFKMRNSPNGNKSLVVKKTIWDGLDLDYGMLALGNVFRTKEEAIKSEDKLLEKLNELLEGE